jgi:hypothetical protein
MLLVGCIGYLFVVRTPINNEIFEMEAKKEKKKEAQES